MDRLEGLRVLQEVISEMVDRRDGKREEGESMVVQGDPAKPKPCNLQ